MTRATIEFGAPDDLRWEFEKLQALHQDFPGMLCYGGDKPAAVIAEAFAEPDDRLPVYE